MIALVKCVHLFVYVVKMIHIYSFLVLCIEVHVAKHERLSRIGLERTLQTDIKGTECEGVRLHASSTG
jgi:hypothetical protein